MKKLFLLGKKYSDTIMYGDYVKNGETNSCNKIHQTQGGIYNFYEAEINNWEIHAKTFGEKKAYIVSNKSQSSRTSFVMGTQIAEIHKRDITNINKNFDWLHISYLDDIECYKEMLDISIPFSVDFCTDEPRKKYLNILNKAKILFDSRERRRLYNNLDLIAPIVLHDEYGIEIIQNKKTIYCENNYPLDNLEVNGAGDIFAALFLNNYYSLGLANSASTAMKNTTHLLINRIKNEKKI